MVMVFLNNIERGPRTMRISPGLPVLVFGLSLAAAHAAEPTLTLDVWPGKPPGETGSIGPEEVVDQKPGDKPIKILTNITHPTLMVFRPARDRDTGASVVVCPGGGYNILAWDLE